MKIRTNLKEIEKVVSSRYIEKIYPSKKELKKILISGRRLTIYIGVDPTAPHLHLGHSTNFLLLKKFQQLGHKVIFLIGSFTAQIGDPGGRLNIRRPLSQKEVLGNCKGYKKQAGSILDFSLKKNPVQLKFNDQWLSKITLEQLIKLMTRMTVGQLIKREMFQRRIKEKKEIYLHEFLYPLLQGYDSVVMKVDIEMGGNDQTFNMMVGRKLVKDYLKKEKLVIATKLLVNPKTKRKLMSKSEGNFIALDDKPGQMYGKIMALPDEVILPVNLNWQGKWLRFIMEKERLKNPKRNLIESLKRKRYPQGLKK
jgi:tyrosyl-tRNA synthetase